MGLVLVAFDIPLQWDKIEGKYFNYMIYLSIGATLFTVFLYQKATVILGPNAVMSYVYLNPAIVAIIMYLFENETINQNVLLGILLSIFATIILLKENAKIKKN